MQVTCPKPPFIPPQLLAKFIRDYFPLETVQTNSIKEFVCYSDRNYYFTGVLKPGIFTTNKPCTEFVLKFLNWNDSSDLKVVDGLTKMKKYLYEKGFTCPYPIPSSLSSKSDNIVIRHTTLLKYIQTSSMSECINDISSFVPSEDDWYYCISVLAFVKGDVYQNEQHSSQFLYDVGYYIGSMDKQLTSFSHSSLESRQMCSWNLSHLLTLRERKAAIIKDLNKSVVFDKILNDFETKVIPIINDPNTHKGIIHNDATLNNMILLKQDDGSFIINGVIDLSDCVYGPYLFELAISMCSYMMSGEDPINYIAPFLRGYLKIFPLSKASLGVLCYVILGRLAQLHINSIYSYKLDPTNEYILEISKSSLELINKLMVAEKQSWYRSWGLV